MKVCFSMKRLLVALLNMRTAIFYAKYFRALASRDYRRARTAAQGHRALAGKWRERARMYRFLIAEAMTRVLEPFTTEVVS